MLSQQWCIVKGRQSKIIHPEIKEKNSPFMMNDVRVLKATFFIVFVLGITFAFFVGFFLDLYGLNIEKVSNTKVRVFSPFPFEHHMELPIEQDNKESLELTIRKADVEPSGKTFNFKVLSY